MVPSQRASCIRSFKVMDVVAKADEMAREGRQIYHLEVGQPQSSAPQAAVRIAQQQLGTDRLGYTAARGEAPLREAIAGMYMESYNTSVSPSRIHLTPGSSGAFTLAFMAAFDVGDAVGLPASCYPCYRNLLGLYGCEVVTLPVDERYNVTAKQLATAQQERATNGLTKLSGLILSSPANPTGEKKEKKERKKDGMTPLSGLILSSPANPTGEKKAKEMRKNMLFFSSTHVAQYPRFVSALLPLE